MLHMIDREVDHTDIVSVDEGGALKGAVELLKKLAQPGGLCHAVGHNAVLVLCAGAGDDELQLGGLGDEVGAQEHDISGSGPARVGTTNPVSVGVDHELRFRGGPE
jgi:shikimate kinase